jgi:hypothetical protein
MHLAKPTLATVEMAREPRKRRRFSSDIRRPHSNLDVTRCGVNKVNPLQRVYLA